MPRTYEQALKVVEGYEKQLRKDGALKVNYIPFKPDISSVKSFLISFLIDNARASGSSNYTTRVLGDRGDKRDTSYNGARRSISDLYRLTLHYLGEQVTLLEVMEAMYIIVNDTTGLINGYDMYNNICGTVNRRVFNTCTMSSNTSYRFNNNSIGYHENGGSDEADIKKSDYRILCDKAYRQAIYDEEQKQIKLKADKEAKRIQAEKDRIAHEELLKQRRAEAIENEIKRKLNEVRTKQLSLQEKIDQKIKEMENHPTKSSLVKGTVVTKERQAVIKKRKLATA